MTHRQRRRITLVLLALASVLTLVISADSAYAGTTLTAKSGWWFSDIEGVPLGDAGCGSQSNTTTGVALYQTDWNYWDNCGATVVSASAEGLPAPPNGNTVVKWFKPLGSDQVFQKLNRTWVSRTWPQGQPGPSATDDSGSPANVTAKYIVNQYIRSSDVQLNPGHGWLIPSEFKEDYLDSVGTWHQDPTWGILCNNYDFVGVGCALSQGGLPRTAHGFALSVIADHWVTTEYDLYQGAADHTGHGGRIELRIDGVLMDTGYESDMHVGTAAFAPLSKSLAWFFIAGQYTSNQTTNGVPDYQNTQMTSYVDSSQVLPADTTAPSAPTNLTGSENGSHQVVLTWNASTDDVGVNHYVVKRDGATIASPTGTSYTDPSPTHTTHTYQVFAVDLAGNTSAGSNTFSIRVR